MDNIKQVINGKYGKSDYKLSSDYQNKYDTDVMFRKLANSTKLPTDTLKKYTTKLEISVNEINNCKNCPNILECKNEVSGYVYYPEAHDDILEFSYVPCKYKKELDEVNAIAKSSRK